LIVKTTVHQQIHVQHQICKILILKIEHSLQHMVSCGFYLNGNYQSLCYVQGRVLNLF
jgi:hypothetical protein